MIWFQANSKPHPNTIQPRGLVETSGKSLPALKQNYQWPQTTTQQEKNSLRHTSCRGQAGLCSSRKSYLCPYCCLSQYLKKLTFHCPSFISFWFSLLHKRFCEAFVGVLFVLRNQSLSSIAFLLSFSLHKAHHTEVPVLSGHFDYCIIHLLL